MPDAGWDEIFATLPSPRPVKQDFSLLLPSVHPPAFMKNTQIYTWNKTLFYLNFNKSLLQNDITQETEKKTNKKGSPKNCIGSSQPGSINCGL